MKEKERTALPAEAPAVGLGERIRRRGWTYLEATSKAAVARVRSTPDRIGTGTMIAIATVAEVAPERALDLVRRVRTVGRRSSFLAGAEALLTARVEGWTAASPLFERLVAEHPAGAASGLLRAQPTPPLDLALPDPARATRLDPKTAAAIVVYTTALGGTPPPRPMFYAVPGLRFLCLTDQTGLALPGWETVPPPDDAPADPARAAAWARALPHRALAVAAPGARASLYLAPETWFVGNLHTLLTRWCHDQDIVLWRDERAADWNDLAERHLILQRPARTGAVLAQARDCEARGTLPNRGAPDLSAIWRRHAEPAAQALMESWWEEDTRHPEGLAALALAAVLAKDPPLRPRILPAALGPAGDNAFTARLAPPPPHRHPATVAPARTSAALPVAVVYAEEHARSASTFLRGQQLSEIVAAHHRERLNVRYTADLANLSGHVVILTKGALAVHSVETISDLARRNRAVMGSWDDMLPDPDKVAATTASMTLSHRQTLDFTRRFPDRPAYMVTHHVNAQIGAGEPPKDRARIGYFGFLNNTHRPKSLGRTIDLIGINTMNVETDWLQELPRYNCHWIVRRKKPHDGAKPFLKGFVAARCGAVVVVGRDEEDALQYLGDDYPFYIGGTDPAQLEYDTARILASFGSAEWRRAQEIMAQVAERSSDAQVAAEFLRMVEDMA
jgi:hypothetical protein